MFNYKKYVKLLESHDIVTLYHGTCLPNAKQLLSNGWSPSSGSMGANQGQSKYLYLSTDPDDALWFAEEKGCNTVLKVECPKSYLMVDPEDGVGETVDEEINDSHGLPGKVVLTQPLPVGAFSLFK